jgi:mannose-6-phosphate isomerase-like protein (cupin superfamily)
MSTPEPSSPRLRIAQLDEITPVACPCGQARRAFGDPDNTLATVHLTDISKDSRAHYHKKMTEIYIVLEGEGVLEADGKSYPLKPMTTVMIPPGCVHRAVGNLRIINVPMPPFDPADEFAVGHTAPHGA